jgi:hypothetical protein
MDYFFSFNNKELTPKGAQKRGYVGKVAVCGGSRRTNAPF